MTQELIAQIVAQEWAMFNDVQNNGGRADCQNNPKEFEIMRLVAEGLNNKEIATTLFLSEGTVRNYLSSTLEKLELRDRTQLAIYYYKHVQ